MKRSIVTLCGAAMLVAGCGSFQSHRLQDGRTILALRNIEDVYPMFGSTFKAEADLAYQEKSGLMEGTASSAAQTEIVRLYQDLDAITADVRNSLVAGYSGFIAALSAAATADERKSVFAGWESVLQKVLELAGSVREINEQIARAKTAVSNTEYQRLSALSGAARKVAADLRR